MLKVFCYFLVFFSDVFDLLVSSLFPSPIY